MRLRRQFLAFAAAFLLLLPAGVSAAGGPEPPRLRLPATAEPVGYTVDLMIDPSKETFRGSVDIEIRLKEKTDLLWLNATDLAIRKASATAGGASVGVRVIPGGNDFVGFAFGRAVGPGTMRLHAEYAGKLDETSTQGLFRQKDGDDWYAFSQLEATDARRAFPCFDEPSYKVPFTLTLRIPKGTSAVSNTPVASQTVGRDGMRVVRFRRTEPLPAYLVALGVGPFEYVDAGRAGAKKTPIRIVTPRGKASQARYASQTTGPLLERLEAYFGIPFPYAKLDQVAIPQTVTFGAMENAGLITWSERILLAPPAEETIGFQRQQASINAHEMAHQWFGDLVTLAWWDDVWLNESFATWMSDRTLIEWKPEWHEDVKRVGDRSRAMDEDSLVSARKIRQEILSADDIVNAFDAISYQKGGAVLAMFESWIGKDMFRAGVRRYLAEHRFGSATSRDFLRALEAESHPGVAAAFSTFLEQPGTPLLEVGLDCREAAGKLSLSQKRFLPVGTTGSTAQVWHIPVCTRSASDGKVGRACALLTQPSGSIPAPSGGCPAWVLADDGELGYYRAIYRGDLLPKLLAAADRELTLAERVGLIHDVDALAVGGALPMAQALALVPRFAGDPSRAIVEATIVIAEDTRERHLLSEDLRGPYARFVSKVYGARASELGFAAKAGEDDDTRLLRVNLVPFVAREGEEPELRAEARRLALAWLDDRSALDADMVGSVLGVAARHGDRALFERFRDAARTAPSRRDRGRLYGALGGLGDPAVVREALALVLEPSLDARETDAILYAALKNDAGARPLWEFVKENYDAILARMPREATEVMPFFGGGVCEAAQPKDVEAFFAARIQKLPGGPRNLAQTLESIDLCVAARAAQESSVRDFLAKY
jgi:alanyl aminopeptidase